MPDKAPPGVQPERGEKTFPKEYVVVGPKAVGGVSTGGTVVLELTQGQEENLIEAGHIAVPAPPARAALPEVEEEN